MTPLTPKLSEVARHLVIPGGIVSTGWPAVRATCATFGITFDPWQDGAGQVILGKGADGLYAADAVVLSIPRQVGKTFLIGWIIFALCLIYPGLTVLWTAHRYKTATETYNAMRAMSRRPKVKPHVEKTPQGSGDQAIIFTNGSRILFGARERGFGRGFSEVDIEVFDEAQILTENAIDDMIPATNVAPNPLILYMGTPPKPTDAGEVFARHRAEALSGESSDEVYIELSADPNADPLDRAQWSKGNPSYPSRTNARAILRMRKNLTPDAFLREGLGVWDDDGDRYSPVSLDDWHLTSNDVPKPGTDPVFFVTVAKEMRSATVVAAFLHGGTPHVEVADYREGTAWLSERLRELKRRHPMAEFVGYAAGPMRSWVPALAEHGIDLRLLTGGESVSACTHFQQVAKSHTFTHASDDVLTDSLRGAKWRDLDVGGWVWDWRRSTSDPAPIAAVTGALWALESEKPSVYEERGAIVL